MAIPPDFVSYSQGQAPGSYVFQRRDGAPIVLGGPTAERIAKELDQSNPYGKGPPPTMPENRGLDNNPYQDHPGASLFSPGSQATARAPSGGRRNVTQADIEAAARARAAAAPATAAPAVSGGRRNVTQADINAQAAWRGSSPQAQAARAAEQAAHDKEWAAKDAAAAAAKAAPAEGVPDALKRPEEPSPQAAPKQFSTKGGRLVKTADGWQMVQSGGGGVSKAALEKKAGQGVLTSKSAETTQEGGYPMDPNYLPEMERVSNTRRVLNAAMADREAAGAAAEALRFAEEAAAAKERAALEARVAERVKSEAQRAEQEYDSAREEFRGSKIDPERYFRGDLGTLRRITSAIGQALSIGGSQGQAARAQAIVNSNIDRDIAAQREDIRIRGQSVDNALSQLTRKLGDQKAAESVLRSIQGDYAANLAKARAAATKRPEIMALAQKFDLDEQQRQIQLRKEYLQEVSGKITQKTLGEFAYPKAGGTAGARPLTIEEAKSLASLDSAELGNAKTEQELLAGAGGGASESQVKAYNDNANAVDAGDADLAKYAASIGAKRNPETGLWEGDVGGVWYTGPGGSDRSQGIAAQSATLAPGIARALEGGSAPNADNIKMLQGELTSMSGNKMLTMLNSLQQRIDSQRQSVESSVPGRVVQQRTQRGRQRNVDRATAAPLPPPRVVNP